ncbi:MAG: hypothetical protein LBV43_14590 [Prevotella sp.]|jgi:hypothetical protein|nr:hypothetical protein [Prevotella sp.]
MKKLILILAILTTSGLYNLSTAQNINVNININVNKQPAWGPEGYDYVGYYYFPDLDIYFDVDNSLFYYSSGGKWVSNKYLPDKYRKYDLYNLYKVVINDSQPWIQNKKHKKEYSNYKGDKTQNPIRYSTDTKYNTSKSNTNVWVDTNKDKNKNNNSQESSNQKNANGQKPSQSDNKNKNR